MTTLDDHDATDDALTRLGTRLRTDADRRPADLDRLGTRIHAERQRARLAVVAGCVAVVLLLGVAIGLRSGASTASLQVGRTGALPGNGAVTTEVPSWTVNPSLPADPANGEVWGVDVVYDPAVWDYARLSDTPALDLMRHLSLTTFSIGMAGYRDEPRLQAYWQGADARQAAESARDELVQLPGIVSVEVGRAAPTSRPPGTGPVVPGVPTTAPTTLAPVERPELPDPRPTQDEILADGVATDDEYETAFWSFVECIEADGIEPIELGRDDGGLFVFRVDLADAVATDVCYQAWFARVDRTRLFPGAEQPTTSAP